jgi:hypothetical protein
MLKEHRKQKQFKEFQGQYAPQETVTQAAPKFGNESFAVEPGQRALPQTMKSSPWEKMSPDQLIGLTKSPNEYEANAAQEWLKRRFPEKMDPKDLYLQGGEYRGAPRALEHTLGIERAKQQAGSENAVEWITDPNNPLKQVPQRRSDLLASTGPGVGSALPLTLGGAPNNLNSRPTPVGEGERGTVIPPEVLAAEKAGAPFVATQEPGGPVRFGQAPSITGSGPSRPSEQGKAVTQQMAQELPKLEAGYYGSQAVLDNVNNIRQSIADTPGWFWGTIKFGPEALRTAHEAGMVDAKAMKAFQTLSGAEAQLMGPMAKESNFGMNQGFTDKDREFVKQRLPGPGKTQAENEQGLKEIETYLRTKQQQDVFRMKEVNPGWRPAGNPTSPGAGSPPATGPVSAAERDPNDPYWTASASASGGNDAMPEQAPTAEMDSGNVLARTLKGMERGIGMAGVGITQRLPESVTSALGLQAPTYQDVKTIRESDPKTFVGKAGSVVGEAAANPTTYLKAASWPGALVSGAASGFTAPSESKAENRANIPLSMAGGAAGKWLGNKIPATEVANANQAAARQGFEDIPLSSKQIAGKSGSWEAEGIAKRQAKELSARIMAGTGSPEKVMSTNALNVQEKVLKNEFNRLFPSSRPMYMDTNSASKLQGTLGPYDEVLKSPQFIERAPGIKQLYDYAGRSLRSGRQMVIPADVAQSAIQDLARVENKQMQVAIRKDIKDFVAKNLTSAEQETFEKINTQWGNLSDAKRMRHQGGVVVPSSIHGKTAGSDAGRAAQFIEQFDVQNPKGVLSSFKIPELMTTGAAAASATAGIPYGAVVAAPMVKHIVDRTSGSLQGALGTSRVLNADPSTKAWIEMLRRGTQIGPREITE